MQCLYSARKSDHRLRFMIYDLDTLCFIFMFVLFVFLSMCFANYQLIISFFLKYYWTSTYIHTYLDNVRYIICVNILLIIDWCFISNFWCATHTVWRASSKLVFQLLMRDTNPYSGANILTHFLANSITYFFTHSSSIHQSRCAVSDTLWST